LPASHRGSAQQFFISPSALAYDALERGDVPLMDLDGRWFGRHRPSMVAIAGSTDIRCAPYHCFGTQALSDAAVAALEGRMAVDAVDADLLFGGTTLPDSNGRPGH